VIGGGASGLMAAGVAGARGKKVLLLEKNKKVGEKLRITGGGRCNITNNTLDLRTLLARYGDAEQALYSSYSQFGVKGTFEFFESLDPPLKTEANNRTFPQSENALDVVKVLEKYCKENGVTILTNTPVEKIITESALVTKIVTKGGAYTAKSIILATGGISHPETGSTGDGFKFLKDLGHTIASPTPSIVPIAVSDLWVKSLAGVTAQSIKINFFALGKKQFSKSGSLLFTHFGLSGPLILNCAKDIADLFYLGAVTGTIDLFPKKDFNIVEAELIGLFDSNKNKIFKNALKEFVPPGMPSGLLTLMPSVLAEKKVHSITKEERKTMIHLLKALPFTVEGLMGFDKAVVADGGVLINEIDMRTMQSKKYKNLYVTGDLLHITRPSGGYSLQLCWTTGYVAGINS